MTQETNDYLAHHGILGQKWGVRRYQNYDGSLTALGRKHRGLSEKSSKSTGSDVKKAIKTIRKAQEKRRAERAEELEAARKVTRQRAAEEKAQREYEQHEKLKRQIRNHPRDMYKYRNELTKEEAKELIEQIEWDRKISDIRFDEYRRFNNRAREFATSVTTAATILNQGVSLYNNTALIYNAMIDHQIKAGAMSADEGKQARVSKLDWKDGKKKNEDEKDN